MKTRRQVRGILRILLTLLLVVVVGILFQTPDTARGVPPDNTTPVVFPTPPATSTPDRNLAEPQTTQIIVDDQDSGFSLGGPSNGWHHSSSSDTTYNRHAYWTYTTDTWYGTDTNNWATWTPHLPESGQWGVFAYIPYVNTGRYDTTRARYQIHSASGNQVVEVNQNDNTGWISLGIYTFNAGTGGYVRLEDVTPDWSFIYNGRRYRKTIKFDAVKWVQEARPGGNLSITVDRGEGATYRIGDAITMCYTVPYSVYVRILRITSEGTTVILQGNDDGTGGCIPGRVGSPAGRHTLRIEMVENGQVTRTAETWFWAEGGETVSVDIWVDRGEGSVYYVGDSIQACYSVSRSIYVRIYDCPAGEACEVILEGTDDGTGGCINGTVTPPTGWETLRIEAIENGQIVAQDETYFYVTDNVETKPPAGYCHVQWMAATSNYCSGEFGLHSPERITLFSDYRYRPSPDTAEIGPFDPDTSLEFYIRPWGDCAPAEYLSTSANAHITELGTNRWQIEWEDLPPDRTDSDYNDLVVEIECGIQPSCQDAAEFASQSSYPTVQPGQAFQIYFEVRNTGSCTWRQGEYYLANINDTSLGAIPRQDLTRDVRPGDIYRWHINMTAPVDPGIYRTQWMLKHGEDAFGPNMYIDVTVAVPTYSISGKVVTTNGQTEIPIPGATVEASGPVNVSTTTGRDGRYTLANLPAGTYSLFASADGYAGPISQGTNVPPDQTGADFTLCLRDHWRGEYYDNRSLTGDPIVRCDEKIDFYWGRESPISGIASTHFSVRWAQNVHFPEGGSYRFRTFAAGQLNLLIYSMPVIIDEYDRIPFAEKSEVWQLHEGRSYTSVQYISPQGNRDAMAHLTWYRCPDGQDDCDMNITPQYQTRYSNTSDPDHQMPRGCPSQTIADVGCLITSYAMAFQQLGMDTNPEELNKRLSENGGYSGGWCKAYLKGHTYIEKFVAWKTNGGMKGLKWIDVSSVDSAKEAIRSGHPVIMYKGGGGDGHWFLAVDVADIDGVQTFGINDPIHKWDSRLRGTLDHRTTLRDDAYRNAAFKFYVEPKYIPSTSLEFLARGAEILLTDAQGRRVGYDAATGRVVHEIPNSFYYDSKIVPPGEQSDGLVERTLFLSEDAMGSYTLKVVNPNAMALSLTGSNFEIDVVGLDASLNVTEATINGTIQPGAAAEYRLSFYPGQDLRVAHGSRIYLPFITRSTDVARSSGY